MPQAANIHTSLMAPLSLAQVIDPPFVAQDVWRKYALTAKLLQKPDAKILLCTIPENADVLAELLGVKPTAFMPACPTLTMQFVAYTNYESELLAQENPELG